LIFSSYKYTKRLHGQGRDKLKANLLAQCRKIPQSQKEHKKNVTKKTFKDAQLSQALSRMVPYASCSSENDSDKYSSTFKGTD
jgi:hypothetical protein